MTNWFVDDGAQLRTRGNIRFYRASYKDRWRLARTDGTNVVPQRPLASEEVYALHNVVLSGGQNFVALHGKPYANTFEAVFGSLEAFPGGSSASPATGATVVEFYGAGTNAPTSQQYFLNEYGRWMTVETGTNTSIDVTTNQMGDDFFSRGFAINLPSNLVELGYATTTAFDYSHLTDSGTPVQVEAMVWTPIAQVPTNNVGFSQRIYTGDRSVRTNQVRVYNVASLRLPVAVHPSQLNLIECGFVGGMPGASDEIYTMNTATKDLLNGHSIYCDTNGVWRFMPSIVGTPGDLVPAGFFKPNDVLVIISRNAAQGGYWTWNYHPAQFYALPTRWMGWTDVPASGALDAEPTVNSSALSFTNVSATQITANWTVGNGARRIVVIRQGTSTTWTPLDGTAPSGVNANFPSAVDQGGGNRICYDGTGGSCTLMGRNSDQSYAGAVYEESGTGTAVNYLIGGPLSGVQTTY